MDIKEILKNRRDLRNRVFELEKKLYKTDYVDNKISAATAKYLVDGDKTELLALYEEYKPMLAQRQAWRDEINELREKLYKLEEELKRL